MIKRPEDLENHAMDLVLNLKQFTQIEVDLDHINRGKSGLRQTELTTADVAELVYLLLNNEIFEAIEEKKFGDQSCFYFIKEKKIGIKSYKVVFCICSDRPSTIGVITLFRLRGLK